MPGESFFMKSRYFMAGAASLGFAFAALTSDYSATAQVPPPPPGSVGAMEHHFGHPGPWSHGERDCTDIEAHHAAMRAFAYVKLHITDAQKSAWASFEEKSKAADLPLVKLCEADKGKPEPTTLPERLAKMDVMQTAHLEHFHATRSAIEALYSQLTPEQKTEADHLLASHPWGGPPHEGGPGPHGDHGWRGAPPPPDGKPGPQ